MSQAEPTGHPRLDGAPVNPNQWDIPTGYELDAVRQHYDFSVLEWSQACGVSYSMWNKVKHGRRDLGTGALRRATDVAKHVHKTGDLPRGRYE